MMPLTRDTVMFALACHIGEAAGIHARDLVIEICGETSAGDERCLRSIIEELRDEGAHICGMPSTGYFMAATEEELLRFCEWLLQRCLSGLGKIAAMRRVSLPDFRGQLRLPNEFTQPAPSGNHAQPAVAQNTGNLCSATVNSASPRCEQIGSPTVMVVGPNSLESDDDQ